MLTHPGGFIPQQTCATVLGALTHGHIACVLTVPYTLTIVDLNYYIIVGDQASCENHLAEHKVFEGDGFHRTYH